MQLICNQALCLNCNTHIISHHRHDFKSCNCGQLSVDGGRDYKRVLFKHLNLYQDLSIYSDSPFHIIRDNLYRGSRGVSGKEPLTYIKLSEIDDQYLDNIIKYQEDNGYTDSIDYKYQLLEREYRGYIPRELSNE